MTYDKRKVMQMAHNIRRLNPHFNWGECLKTAHAKYRQMQSLHSVMIEGRVNVDFKPKQGPTKNELKRIRKRLWDFAEREAA